MKNQIILGLAFLSFMTLGSGPGHPASSQASTPPLIDEQGEEAVSGPKSDLMASIMTWLSADFALPENYHHPRIAIISPMKMAAVRYRGLGASLQARVVSDEQWLKQMRDTVALYEDNSRTIYLREGWTDATAAEISVLVHEMVHHLQNLRRGEISMCTGARKACIYGAEKMARGGRTRFFPRVRN